MPKNNALIKRMRANLDAGIEIGEELGIHRKMTRNKKWIERNT